MTYKGLAALVVAVVIAVVAALALQQSEDDSPLAGGIYFSELLQNVNEVSEVRIKSASNNVTLIRDGGNWYVAEKDRYPAANEKARAVILGLARLEKIEPKTSNPKLYEKLGVQGITETNAESTLIRLISEQGKDLAVVLVGKTSRANGKPGLQQMYVRRPDDAQTWLVEGSLPKLGAAADWLRQELVKIDASRVWQVRVKHEDGEVLTVLKKVPAGPDFALLELNPGEILDTQYSLNRIVDSFRELRFADVISADKAPVTGNGNVTEVELLTFDGLRITMKAHRIEDKIYARLSAAFDQALIHEQPTDVKIDALTPVEASNNRAAEGKSKPKPKLQTQEQTRAEAEGLQTLWQSWVYVIPAYQFDNITVKKKDLLQKEKKSNGDKPAAKP